MCWLGIIASVIVGIVVIAADENMILQGLLIMLLGGLLSWVGSFMAYGFGQLVENSDFIADELDKLSHSDPTQKPIKQNTFVAVSPVKLRKCICCGRDISEEICPHCGQKSVLVRTATVTDGTVSSVATLCERCLEKFRNQDEF